MKKDIKMLTEKEYILTSFKNNFSRFSDMPLVIYGISKNTKYILDNFPDFNIAGLMDEVRTGDTVYGKPVISCEDALKHGVKAIIIVARASNTKIIYRRIAEFTAKSSIEVFDINGNLLSIEESVEKSFEKYKNINPDILEPAIDTFQRKDLYFSIIQHDCLVPQSDLGPTR